ncbi:retropepsin-like aspartic protease [Paracraurococcus ruber]|uniref:retropepsin-like aspartic protease n=1 Tax=Paracraurococcus ruber TaxID=77675 RepID=UPI001058180B|nr:retropepsin-like aspartic protease [Paracraurococcus ruber]
MPWAWVVLGIVLTLVAGGMAMLLRQGMPAPAPPQAPPQAAAPAAPEPPSALPAATLRRLAPAARQLADRLAEEPCNRTVALDLAQALNQAAEYRAMLIVEAAARERCGLDEALLHPRLQAQLLSADLAGAARTADELVERYPADPQAWGWRAELREKAGDWTAAAQDWRQALGRFADPGNVALSTYYSLARAEARAGRPCDALLTLRDFVAFDPVQRRTQQLGTLMRDWRQQGGCPAPFGSGGAELRYDARAGAVIVPAEFDGTPARVILDTGATRTTLTTAFAARIGLRQDRSDGALVGTASGTAWVAGGRVRRIAVGGAVAHDVPVHVLVESKAALGPGVDALLGLSFLGNFSLQLGNGVLELRPLP